MAVNKLRRQQKGRKNWSEKKEERKIFACGFYFFFKLFDEWTRERERESRGRGKKNAGGWWKINKTNLLSIQWECLELKQLINSK